MKVELVDHHGSDLLVCNAARTSFAKESSELNEKDIKLINYLAREKHVLPFRHPQITLRCKAPIFLARQLGKHQVGLSWSEESRRYIDSEPEFFWPDKWRKRAENVKQGSSDVEVRGTPVINLKEYGWSDCEEGDVTPQDVAELCLSMYNHMLKCEVAPELARMILPQNMYVNWVWTGSLLSFFEMYKLRSEGHAQVEAQQFVQFVKDVVSKLYPVSWEALESNA